MSDAEQVNQFLNETDEQAQQRRERQIMAEVLDDNGQAVPTPGRIVWYQTDGRNGLDYHLPAMVTVTQGSHPGNYPDGTPNSLEVPTSPTHVHLTVFTPGGFGSTYVDEEGWETEYIHGTDKDELENLGKPAKFTPGSGTYVEHDVPFDPEGGRRTWRWPERA